MSHRCRELIRPRGWVAHLASTTIILMLEAVHGGRDFGEAHGDGFDVAAQEGEHSVLLLWPSRCGGCG